MQTVTFASEIQNAPGTTGYSVLQRDWTGNVKRITVLYLRDWDGFVHNVLYVPADAVRGAF